MWLKLTIILQLWIHTHTHIIQPVSLAQAKGYKMNQLTMSDEIHSPS